MANQTKDRMITPEQKAFFDTFGFIRLPQQFSAQEMEAVTREADRLWEEQRGGGPPSGQDQNIQEMVEKGPLMTQMVVDDRIFGTVEGLLGPGFIWNGSEGNLSFSTEHPWHTDRPDEPHATTYSFHLYLDQATADTGSIRVIPGSHRPPLYDDLLPLNEEAADSTMKVYGLSPTDIPGVAVESDPGDIGLLQPENLPRGVRQAARPALFEAAVCRMARDGRADRVSNAIRQQRPYLPA